MDTDMAYNVIADSSRNPDIVIATPGGLLSSLRDLDRGYVNDWLAGVGNIVFDEADMLMTGGYSSKVQILVEVRLLLSVFCKSSFTLNEVQLGRNISFSLNVMFTLCGYVPDAKIR